MTGRPLSEAWPHWLSWTPFYFLHVHWTADALGYGKKIFSMLKKKKKKELLPALSDLLAVNREDERCPQFSLGS